MTVAEADVLIVGGSPVGLTAWALLDLGPHGALLVRPDGHIGARWSELPADDSALHRSLVTITA
jgi:hypothetical protein